MLENMPICVVEGCDRASRYKGVGMCDKHRTRVRRHGNPHVLLRSGEGRKPKTDLCHMLGCPNVEYAKGICRAHYITCRKYDITASRLIRMQREQDNRCAICRRFMERGKCFVDHCHLTGNVRSLLCPGCNTGLGMFKDDPELLTQAAAYLRSHAEGSE